MNSLPQHPRPQQPFLRAAKLAVVLYAGLGIGGILQGAESREALLRRTWEAVCRRESGGNPRAYNRRENAAGIGQIRPVMVAECNRLQKARVFTLAHRWDPFLSYEMFRIHSLRYAPNGTPEQWARLWNGGASGLRKKSTIAYGRAVVRLMEGR